MVVGEKQKLFIVKLVEFGVYLAESIDDEDKVLLPRKQIPENAKIGDEIEVFVYRDSKDRIIATTNSPKIKKGELAMLRVAQVSKIGAFLDWGLEKDLFLPFREQTYPLKEGAEVLVSLYEDKSGRLCATMKVYSLLAANSPYQKDDQVEGIVYEISDNFGAFVAVDNQFLALIPKQEMYGEITLGSRVSARVTKVKEDGKLALSVRDKVQTQLVKDAKVISDLLVEHGGSLGIGDKSNPEDIRELTKMSKNEFKRAAGRLYKLGEIEIHPDRIVLLKK